MPTIAFGLANFVARPLNYHMTEGWSQGEQATSAYFQPIATFHDRLAEYLTDVRDLGFEAVDFWLPILDPQWVTDEHRATTSDLLKEYDLKVVAVAGNLGKTPEAFEKNCVTAAALGAPVLGGGAAVAADNRGFVVDMLQKYDLKWAYENHPEKSPEEQAEKAGGNEYGRVGVCVDTGWYGTHGYDAAEALQALEPRLFHVHLKDVLKLNEHNTCRFGLGVVPIERCVRVLQAIGYQGGMTIEHEPDEGSPLEDIGASFYMLQDWLRE